MKTEKWVLGFLVGMIGVLSILLVYVIYHPNIPKWADGNFNPITKQIWCINTYACLHEQGHRLDDSKGWVSKTKSFQEAANEYYWGKFPGIGTPLTKEGWGGYGELYAEIYAQYNGATGAIPDSLQKFFAQGDS